MTEKMQSHFFAVTETLNSGKSDSIIILIIKLMYLYSAIRS